MTGSPNTRTRPGKPTWNLELEEDA